LNFYEKNKTSLTKWLVVIGFIFSVVALIVVKSQVESFATKYFVMIFVFLVIISLILYFGFGIIKKYQDNKSKLVSEEKLPPVASEEQLKNRCEQIMKSVQHRNHIKRYLNVNFKYINKNLIYDFEIIPEYNDKTSDDVIHIILNAHYIDRLPSFLYNPSPQKVAAAMNDASSSPNPDAEIERRQETDLLTGKEIIYEKKTPGNTNAKKTENKKELA